MVTTVYTASWPHGISSAPPRVEVVSGFVPEHNFAPNRLVPPGRSRSFKTAKGGGGARVNTHGAPAVAKQTKPSDSLQVQVEPVVPIP